MKLLITGGAGFIGNALTRSLLADGHEVVAIDSLSPQIHGDVPAALTLPDGIRLVREDIRRMADRPELLDGVDAVVHLAAETGTGQSMYRIAHYVDVNELGTAALLEAIARCKTKPRKLVLASSRAIYGEGAYEHPRRPGELLHASPRTPDQLARGDWAIRDADGTELVPVATPESFAPRPGSVYAATKMAQELLVASACPGLGVHSSILRFQNVYGEGQSLQNPYTGIISIFFNRARQGEGINIYEDGAESRDFVHVDDVVRALRGALEADVPAGAVYNVGTGAMTSVATLAEKLLEAACLDVPVTVTGQYRVGDIRHCFADMRAAKRDIGFVPGVTLEEGLRRFAAWAAGQASYRDRSEEAAAELRGRGLAKA